MGVFVHFLPRASKRHPTQRRRSRNSAGMASGRGKAGGVGRSDWSDTIGHLAFGCQIDRLKLLDISFIRPYYPRGNLNRMITRMCARIPDMFKELFGGHGLGDVGVAHSVARYVPDGCILGRLTS